MNRTLLSLVDNKRYVAAGLMTTRASRSLQRLATNSVPPTSVAGDEKVNSARGSGKNGDDAEKAGGSNGSAKGSVQNVSRKPPPKASKTGVTVGMRLNRWVVTGRIGAGAFGETFTAVEVDGSSVGSESVEAVHGGTPSHAPRNLNASTREEVCIKVEQENKNVLRMEAAALKKMQPCPYVARYLGSGVCSGMNFIVMQRLGPNLADLRRSTPQCMFSVYTTLHLGISCLRCIQGVHELGIVHRDVKPSNFVIGLGGSSDRRQCYIVDFGLARRFRRPNGEVRPPRTNAGFRGTSRYASLASHRQQELGRVDDIWSLLFMLIEFITGTLPWRKHKEKEDIGECKERVIGPDLIKNLPQEFESFLEHLQTLRYEDEPQYDMLFSLMEKAMERGGYSRNQRLDWEPEEESAQHQDVPLSSSDSVNSATVSRTNGMNCQGFIEKYAINETPFNSKVLPPPPPRRRFLPPPADNVKLERSASVRLMPPPPPPPAVEGGSQCARGKSRQEELRSNVKMSDIHLSLDATACDGAVNDATVASAPPGKPPPLSHTPHLKNNSTNRRRRKRRKGGSANGSRGRRRHVTLDVSEDLGACSTFSPCEAGSSSRNRRRVPVERTGTPATKGDGHVAKGRVTLVEPSPPLQQEAKREGMVGTVGSPARLTNAQSTDSLVGVGGHGGKRPRKDGSVCTCHCM